MADAVEEDQLPLQILKAHSKVWKHNIRLFQTPPMSKKD